MQPQVSGQKVTKPEAYLEVFDDRVIVRPDPEQKEIGEGLDGQKIVLADSHVKRNNKGTVVGHGTGTPDFPVYVQKGDRVLFAKSAGYELEDEPGLWVITQADIIGRYVPGKRTEEFS